MPQFTFVCILHDEDVTHTIEASSRPVGNVLCPQCSKPMQRMLGVPNVVMKGAQESNGFYVPESNAELGMPSALDMEKEALKKAEEYLSPEDRELKKDYDKDKAKAIAKLDERVRKIEQKYPGWTETYKKVLTKKVKEKKDMRRI